MIHKSLTGTFIVAESYFQGVSSSHIGELLVSLAALLIIGNIFVGWYDRLRGGSAQKREISFAAAVATKEELEQTHGRISRERKDIDIALGKLESRLGKIEDKIEKLDDRIDNVPERTINLLRSANGGGR